MSIRSGYVRLSPASMTEREMTDAELRGALALFAAFSCRCWVFSQRWRLLQSASDVAGSVIVIFFPIAA